MPVEWPFTEDIIRLGGVGEHKIAAEDGARQQETARSILADLTTQPGAILADEVGMGKTYVALAVVASVVRATCGSGRPVVVMMPPGLARKWPREWDQFKVLCCARPDALAWVRDAYVHTPTEFFKLLDDPRSRRPHLVWMTTGCFWRGLNDPWVKLALIRLARTHTKLSDTMKGRLFKWATSLVRMKSGGLREANVEWLLSHPLSKWHRYLKRVGILGDDSDDPVPADLMRHAARLDFGDQGDPQSGGYYPGLATLLRDATIPGKTGAVSSATENEARKWINWACQAPYWQWIERSSWRSPLLVMDEAHHAKNDDTNLASLFRSEETKQLVEGGVGTPTKRPLLWEKFDRMLFLTATPFQLGHHELIRVLRSFAAAKWSGSTASAGTREEFLAAMEELERRLNENRLAGRRLDRLWGRLARDAVARQADNGDVATAAAVWWRKVHGGGSDEPVDRELLIAIDHCRRTKARAETDPEKPWCSLRPWVIRRCFRKSSSAVPYSARAWTSTASAATSSTTTCAGTPARSSSGRVALTGFGARPRWRSGRSLFTSRSSAEAPTRRCSAWCGTGSAGSRSSWGRSSSSTKRRPNSWPGACRCPRSSPRTWFLICRDSATPRRSQAIDTCDGRDSLNSGSGVTVQALPVEEGPPCQRCTTNSTFTRTALPWGSNMARVPDIIPVSDLRQNAAGTLRRVARSRQPLVVTQRGRAAAVLLSVDAFQRAEREREILKLLARGEREIRAGRGFELDAVLAEADDLLQRL